MTSELTNEQLRARVISMRDRGWAEMRDQMPLFKALREREAVALLPREDLDQLVNLVASFLYAELITREFEALRPNTLESSAPDDKE